MKTGMTQQQRLMAVPKPKGVLCPSGSLIIILPDKAIKVEMKLAT